MEALSDPSGQIKSYLARPDVITIDALEDFGKLERPPVLFLHDKHTDALKLKDKDCQTCHLSENEHLSPKLMRVEDTDRKTVMDIYHNTCIVCHSETLAAGEKSGPITYPTFRDGLRELVLCDKIMESNRKKAWITVS